MQPKAQGLELEVACPERSAADATSKAVQAQRRAVQMQGRARAGQADQCRCKAKLELQGGQEALFYLYRNGGSSYTNKSRSCEGGGFELQRRINCPVPLRAAHLSASVPISSKLTLQMPSLLPFGRTGGSFAELKWRIVLSGQGSSALQVRITGLLLQMPA